MNHKLHYVGLVLMILGMAVPAEAQLFGQNKPRYRKFEFQVLETPHFSIHYYTKNNEVLQNIADWSENWYALHQHVFRDTFHVRNPLILYNSHAEFQQTNAIFGDIGVGTGGVTEGLKNRVVLPVTMINQQTQQVLGHELVHAFQYRTLLGNDSLGLQSLQNIPLWMIEGMAEYVSLGRNDTYTSMWMRDAVLNDDVPNLKKLSGYKYFPYRYGQAFWAFFSGTYGDEMIVPFLKNTAKYGLDNAIRATLNTTIDQLGAQFTESLKTYYRPIIGESKKDNDIGRPILTDENAGKLNVSPAVSPDGKYLIFLSDRNVLSTDLYLADARDGKILRKVSSVTRAGHLDDISFYESSGTWSPDSKQFAFVAYAKGRNIIVIKNPKSGSTLSEIKIPEVSAIAHPAWSPDGKSIAFSGMVEGQTDLFVYNLRTKKLQQLTHDLYSEVYPNWSPDGQFLVFSSDRKTFDQHKADGKWNLHLSRIHLSDLQIEDYDEIFPGADCINPCYDPEGKVYFVSDRDGFRNLYRYDFGNELVQMTELKTGISGIGRYSPAISVSKVGDRITYSHFMNRGYEILQAKADRFPAKAVAPGDVHMEAGILPVMLDQHHQIVSENMTALPDHNTVSVDSFSKVPYKGKLQLIDISGGTGFGINVGGYNGRLGLAGGVNAIFSDMLGNHLLSLTGALNGEIYDFGIAAQYLNQKSRVAWGFSASHVPARAGFLDGYYPDTLSGEVPALRLDEYTLRVFEEQVSALAQYPFSKSLRLEGSVGINYRFFRLDRREYFYADDYYTYYLGQGDRERIPLEDGDVVFGYKINKGFYYNQTIALVGDKTVFGLASPANGYRFRVDFSNYTGAYSFQTASADARFYRYIKPVTFALRALHYTTLGRDADSFYPILIGDMGLVHGYNYGRLREIQDKTGITPDQLSGSKIFVSGFEVRLPFTGPERLAAIKSDFLLSELSVFFDAGVAFHQYEDLGHNGNPFFKPKLVTSTGVSLRVNVFGAFILEPYYAIPLLKGVPGRFGVYLVPGW